MTKSLENKVLPLIHLKYRTVMIVVSSILVCNVDRSISIGN